MGTEQQYKRTIAGSVGAGIGAIFNGSGRTYYILEHKTQTAYHQMGESQKIIVDQIELGRDSSCQVRFDESCDTVSRKHAAIVKEGENWKIVSLSQTNATFVNGVPVQGEKILASGDEIKLSSHGPVMGFIVPQGAQSLVKSIGMTERMNLFRQQALRPYRTAITVLSVILVLAVGGLFAYNIIKDKEHEEILAETNAELVKQNETITAQDEELKRSKKEIAAQEARIDEQERTMDSLRIQAEKNDSIVKAKQEELAKAAAEDKAKIEAELKRAQNAAYAANKKAITIKQELEKEKEALQVATEKAEKAAEAAVNKTTAIEEVEETAEEVTEKVGNAITDIASCFNAVFYVKMDDIVIYDPKDNVEVARFNTEKKIGGTGFLLNDGRFITARRVIEPWSCEEYKMGDLGTAFIKGKKTNFKYRDIYAAISLFGYKVVSNFTAYSPSGISFKFKNTDLTKYDFSNTPSAAFGNLVKIESYTPDRNMKTIFGKITDYEIRWYSAVYQQDWASMAKVDLLNNIVGLPYSNAVSIDPQAGVEVSVIGYPAASGYNDSHNITPVTYKNRINVSGLNNVGIIELSSRRYQEGNDGAPTIQLIDGEWTVIGVLSHTDSADRDVVIPINNTSK